MFSFIIMGLHELSAFNPTWVGPIPLGHAIILPILFTLAFNFARSNFEVF